MNGDALVGQYRHDERVTDPVQRREHNRKSAAAHRLGEHTLRGNVLVIPTVTERLIRDGIDARQIGSIGL